MNQQQSANAITDILGQRYRSQQPLATLRRLLQRRWWYLLAVYAIFVLKNGPVWYLPWAAATLVDAIGQPDAMVTITWVSITAGAMLLINIPGHCWYMWHISQLSRGAEQLLRSAMIRRLQQLSMRFHQDHNTGALQTKVVRDVEQVEQLISQLAHSGLQAVSMLAFAVVYALIDEPIMVLLFVILVPLCLGLVWMFRRQLSQRNAAYRKNLEHSTARINDMITMIPVTRAHAVEQSEIVQSNGYLALLRQQGSRLDMATALFQSSTWVTMQVSQFTCMVVTVLMAVYGWLSLGDVILYQSLFGYIIGALMVVLGMYPILAKGFDSLRSLGEILECPDLELNDGKHGLTQVRGDIRLEQVWFTYPGREQAALRGISLHIPAGQCTAVVGSSGSGKSTLMNLIIGFHRPDQGLLICDDIAHHQLDFRSWRRGLAVVSQQVVLFAGSLRDNICYGSGQVSEETLQQAIASANLSDVIAQLPDGLQTQVGENGVQLSGGQRQRIAIARALVRDPQVIILDEATSALDVISERAVQEAIDRLIVGRTTLIVAHRLSTIRQAEWVVVMEHGEITEQGPRQQLANAQGAFAHLLAQQS